MTEPEDPNTNIIYYFNFLVLLIQMKLNKMVIQWKGINQLEETGSSRIYLFTHYPRLRKGGIQALQQFQYVDYIRAF